MKILIAGASGFIGQNLAQHLVNAGLEVHGLSRTPLQQAGTAVQRWHDYQDIGQLQGYHAVINLAGKAHDTANTTDANAYFRINDQLNRELFQASVKMEAQHYIYFSSVKAVADQVTGYLTEAESPMPQTPYGQSKWEAEKYLLANKKEHKLSILRPCMVYGAGNKGNLNMLYQLVSRGVPFPLGAFENRRSFVSVNNVSYVVEQLLSGTLPPDTYNLADDDTASTNQLIEWIAEALDRTPKIWNTPKGLIRSAARLGDLIPLPLNSERLKKLTENYLVSNKRLISSLGKPLPFKLREEMINTIRNFIQ